MTDIAIHSLEDAKDYGALSIKDMVNALKALEHTHTHPCGWCASFKEFTEDKIDFMYTKYIKEEEIL